jgi:hypothetical protein
MFNKSAPVVPDQSVPVAQGYPVQGQPVYQQGQPVYQQGQPTDGIQMQPMQPMQVQYTVVPPQNPQYQYQPGAMPVPQPGQMYQYVPLAVAVPAFQAYQPIPPPNHLQE